MESREHRSDKFLPAWAKKWSDASGEQAPGTVQGGLPPSVGENATPDDVPEKSESPKPERRVTGPAWVTFMGNGGRL